MQLAKYPGPINQNQIGIAQQKNYMASTKRKPRQPSSVTRQEHPTGISQIDYMTSSHSIYVNGILLHYVKGSHEWQPVISELAGMQ